MTHKKRVGTIIHGALGDCYEQLCSIKKIKKDNESWIGFFAVDNRLDAMKHYKLDMLDEVYLADKITEVDIDYFYQFQINDPELKEKILDKLPINIRRKFKKHNLPWNIIEKHNFARSGLSLDLSEIGKRYLPICMKENNIDPSIFDKKVTIGYLWRYRTKKGAIKGFFQKSEKQIIKTKSDLFNKLIEIYDAHILICGMNKQSISTLTDNIKNKGAFVNGEHNAKYTTKSLNIPSESCTYLKGIGFAAETEILSKCDLVIGMPSGFTEVLWMKRKNPVILSDPPPHYLLKLWKNKMPLFDNNKLTYKIYNTFTKQTAKKVIRFINKQGFLKNKQKL